MRNYLASYIQDYHSVAVGNFRSKLSLRMASNKLLYLSPAAHDYLKEVSSSSIREFTMGSRYLVLSKSGDDYLLSLWHIPTLKMEAHVLLTYYPDIVAKGFYDVNHVYLGSLVVDDKSQNVLINTYIPQYSLNEFMDLSVSSFLDELKSWRSPFPIELMRILASWHFKVDSDTFIDRVLAYNGAAKYRIASVRDHSYVLDMTHSKVLRHLLYSIKDLSAEMYLNGDVILIKDGSRIVDQIQI